jgi:hypothetical protein
MTRIKLITTVVALAISVSACATGPSMGEMTRTDFVKVTPGAHSDAQFQAIRNRCSQAGSSQGTSSLLGNFNFNLGATGMAGLQQGFSNLATVMRSQAAEKSTFQNCMANHGYYPS